MLFKEFKSKIIYSLDILTVMWNHKAEALRKLELGESK